MHGKRGTTALINKWKSDRKLATIAYCGGCAICGETDPLKVNSYTDVYHRGWEHDTTWFPAMVFEVRYGSYYASWANWVSVMITPFFHMFCDKCYKKLKRDFKVYDGYYPYYP